MNKPSQKTELSALYIRNQLDMDGYVLADVGNRDNYLAICSQLGKVTQTREIFLKPKEMVEKFTGYSHLPDEVPFHTDYPLVNVVGLFCEQPDDIGGENLLIDSREILKELTLLEKAALRSVEIPIPRSDDSLPVLTENEGRPPHIYWLPAITLSNLDELEESQASAVKRFDQALLNHWKERKYLSFKLSAGQAIWFDNFVMLHGRHQLDASSKRFQVRAFIEHVN